jgi:DNA-binding NtrC family response regulator
VALIRDLNRKHSSRGTHLSPEVLQWFDGRSWPGNVRELRNLIERAVIMAGEGEVQLKHFPSVLAPHAVVPPQQAPAAADDRTLQIRPGAPINEVEEAYINLVLRRTNNNRRRAAEILGVSLRTLHSRLRTYEASSRRAAANHSRVDLTLPSSGR